jgi:thiol-disulfide isomerase/thioredoxin
MRKLIVFCFALPLFISNLSAQTPLTEAVNFSVKTTESETIQLFPLLDAGNIVVIDFFSTSCGPCQTFAYDFEMAYQNFGSNQGNVFFLAINYNSDNQGVRIFDSIFNITLPSASGLEGGGNAVYEAYQISAYPTVIAIAPDHQIVEQFIWEPTSENITDAVVNAGGTLVGDIELQSGLKNLIVSPNPVSDMVNLNFITSQIGDLSFRIFDLSGRVLVQGIKTGIISGTNTGKVDLKMLPSGVYFLEVKQEKSISVVRKIVVE